MNDQYYDELIQLWRQGTAGDPDPQEIVRLAGRASMRRFDRLIFRRNFMEYAEGALALSFFGWILYEGDRPDIPLLGIVCVGFVLGYLWWHHRGLKPLDPAADGRAFQTAMLARIDKQIRLLGAVRYWSLPILVWEFYVAIVDPKQPWWFLEWNRWSFDTVYLLSTFLVVYLVLVWLNERSPWGVPRLRRERARIEGLYEA